jgi:tetrahydromethanopterin S-methyltransferase subunit F
MCNPILIATIAMAALSVGSTVVGIQNQNNAAEAAGESANNAAKADYQAVSDAANQTNASANAEAVKMKRQALIERGRLTAAQSEAGFIGNSPLREMLNQRLKEQEALGTLDTNQANALVQNSRDSNKIFTNDMSRYNEAMSRRTNSLAAGLMIATSGVQGASSGYSLYKGATR